MLIAAETVQGVTELLAELVWLVLLAAVLAGLAGFLFRWYVRESIPGGLSLLVGLAGVTVYLNTSRALGQVIGGSTLPTEREVALFNIAAFALATGGAILGRRLGDRLGSDLALRGDTAGVDREVGRLVETVGRVIAVELPDEIEDVVGYDPVPPETKEKLAGRTFLFPRRLTVGELQSRLVSRLTADFAVGHVDLELTDDGTVEYLALGSRAAGIGPTLPPETNALAVRADPAFAASAGDLVQLWESNPPRRVLTAELRGIADDTVTLAIDAGDTNKIDPRTEYRLVTLPVGDRPDREFASLLRAADETFSSVPVEADSPLAGLPVGALDVAVIAIKPEDGNPVGLPEPSYTLVPGDRIFAIARPDALRRLEAAAKQLDMPAVSTPTARRSSPDQSEPPAEGGGETPPEEGGLTPPEEGGLEDRVDTSSFDELKDEFESGDGDWARENLPATDEGPEGSDNPTSGEASETNGPDARTDSDDLSGLDIEADSDDDLGLTDFDSGEDFGEGDADFEGFDVGEPDGGGDGDENSEESDDDEDEDESDENAEDDEDESDDENAEDDEESDDEDGNGNGDESDDEDAVEENDDENGGDASSGGKSFQELKSEFESGEADWADEISDSPGGDMRLDE